MKRERGHDDVPPATGDREGEGELPASKQCQKVDPDETAQVQRHQSPDVDPQRPGSQGGERDAGGDQPDGQRQDDELGQGWDEPLQHARGPDRQGKSQPDERPEGERA